MCKALSVVEAFGEIAKEKWRPIGHISWGISLCSQWGRREDQKSTKEHQANRVQGEALGLLPIMS